MKANVLIRHHYLHFNNNSSFSGPFHSFQSIFPCMFLILTTTFCSRTAHNMARTWDYLFSNRQAIQILS